MLFAQEFQATKATSNVLYQKKKRRDDLGSRTEIFLMRQQQLSEVKSVELLDSTKVCNTPQDLVRLETLISSIVYLRLALKTINFKETDTRMGRPSTLPAGSLRQDSHLAKNALR